MKKNILLTAALSVFVLTSASAFADCLSDLKAATAKMQAETDAFRKGVAAEQLTHAKAMMDSKNEESCMMYVQMAKDAMNNYK
ncbi:MAG: hypothetical protein KGQ46_04440 [Hyphomicrobiales bacterium]|nr:hypothetical protein [Hyphomicrobiales bacterium]MDE2114708.1 hypothetical protein [Hyphomicrobiales bacterium]